MSFRSPYPDVEIPDVSLTEFLFAEGFSDRADAPAFLDGGSGESISFAELAVMVETIAAGLAERGIGPDDVVALFAPNLPQWAAVFHGVLRANAIVTSANSMYTPGELAHQLIDSGTTMLITVSPFLDRAAAAAKEAGIEPDRVLTIDPADGHESLADLLATTSAAPTLDRSSRDAAVLPYSSGTTGLAKGVVLTHRNLVANLCQIAPLGNVTDRTKIMAFLPFFHIYGMTVMMNQGLHRRATVVTMPTFDLVEFLRITAEYRVDRLYIAPPVAVALAKHPVVDEYDLTCVDVVVSGAAPLDGGLGRSVARRLDCTVLQGYGMTELSPVSHLLPDDRGDLDLSSSGFTLPNIECKLVDPETGQEAAAAGERGELWVRGPNVMREYLDNPEATAATLDADGFLHTGDVATVTDDGVVHIVDRVKELIKYKGYQVPPAELEALLLVNEAIADAAVIGVTDDDGEEIPKAFVVLQPGASLSGEDVMAFVADRVAPHKKVRRVEFVDAIPKSAAGKILRKDLRALADA